MLPPFPPDLPGVLAQSLSPLWLPRGGVLYRRGEAPAGLYWIQEGWVLLEGPAGPLGLLGPGDPLGEEALLEAPRRATAEALTEAHLLWLPQEALALAEAPGVWLRLLYRRLEQAEERLEAERLPAAQRLARFLLRAARAGEVRLSHQELARAVGVSRETVTKLLGEWVLLGWVDLGYRRVEVLDPQALARAEDLR